VSPEANGPVGERACRNYRATVSYDGTRYHGFQWQPNQLTVQGELTEAIERVTRQEVGVVGAGRTDAGVHALGQVISFRCGWRHPVADLERALNAVLPQDIAVRELGEAEEGFHARYSARRRTYAYSIYIGGTRQPLLSRYALHVREALHIEGMRAASSHLIGRRDLAALGQSPSGGGTVREIFEASWEPVDGGLWLGQAGLRFYVSANAFLRGMVRRLVGSLLEVGRRRWSVAEFAEMLRSRDIGRAAPLVPAHGLCLLRVDYDDKNHLRGG